jgi:hypothetical protein
MATKSDPRIEPGDEVRLRAIVSSVWDNGQVTVEIRSAGQSMTLLNDADIEAVKAGPRAKKRKGERLLSRLSVWGSL